MKNGKIVIGVLAGVAAGVILGILFAPAEGAQSRKKIANKGSDMIKDFKDKFNELLADLEKPNSPAMENRSEKI
jgi:gas vesicle protein